MAKRRGVFFMFPESEPDPRPSGSLRFADPSTVEMTRNIHTFNPDGYQSRNDGAEQHGIRSIGRWSDPNELWRENNRKRGVHEDEDE